MQVSNLNSYHNSLYLAVVLKVDDTNKRYQVYVPALHNSFKGMYEQYIKDNNKDSSIYKDYFPWASSIIEDLKMGDVVYIGFINNNTKQLLILGKDVAAAASIYNENKGSGGGNIDVNISSSDILSLCMPIIMYHEVSLPLGLWPDNIGNDYYGTINGNDNGAWSIGLIQCRAMNAFNLCVDIAKKDTNWKSYFTNHNAYLFKYIDQKVKGQQLSSSQTTYVTTLTLTEGSPEYKGVYKLLTSEIGKQVQRETASQYTITSINKLQNDFKITSPAMIIFCADIMNQYGHYINNSSQYKALKGCMNKAFEYTQTDKSIVQQVEDYYRDWWNVKVNGYVSKRRDTVISYIKQLEAQGKLNTYLDLTELGPAFTSEYVPEYGEYYWPTPLSTGINCYWGVKTTPISYNFKYNSGQTHMGYSNGDFHAGTDFGPKTRGVDGDPVVAVGNGTVQYVSGNTGSQGNCIAIQMDKNKDHYFVYMHLCKKPTLKVGDKVKAGDVVGYMGTTGNSTGTHLHLGLHIGAVWPEKSTSKRIDPLPYLGRRVKA